SQLDRDPPGPASRVQHGRGSGSHDEVRLTVHVEARRREIVDPSLVVVPLPCTHRTSVAQRGGRILGPCPACVWPPPSSTWSSATSKETPLGFSRLTTPPSRPAAPSSSSPS